MRSSVLQPLTLLLAAFIPICSSQLVSTCYADCSFLESTDQYATCDQLQTTIDCYDDNLGICEAEFLASNSIQQVHYSHSIMGCSPQSTPTPGTNCPNVPPMMPLVDTIIALESPNIVPEGTPNSCVMDEPDSLRLCGMFTYSHLKPFSFGDNPTRLETCVVPGAWYLLRHPLVSVVVESTQVPGEEYTMLTKVNVTFPSHECSEQKSYIAMNDFPLPNSFTDMSVPQNPTSALQLDFSEGGTVVTLKALWINTTVIIRQFAGQLSVVFQVPGQISFQGEGLCYGCPEYTRFNVFSFNTDVMNICPIASDSTLYNCFTYGSLRERVVVGNDSYIYYCVFDTYQTESLDSRSMMNEIATDAAMLADVGFVPHPPDPSLPPVTTATTQGVTTTSTTTTTIATTTVQTLSTESPAILLVPSSAVRYTLNFLLTVTMTLSSALALR